MRVLVHDALDVDPDLDVGAGVRLVVPEADLTVQAAVLADRVPAAHGQALVVRVQERDQVLGIELVAVELGEARGVERDLHAAARVPAASGRQAGCVISGPPSFTTSSLP